MIRYGYFNISHTAPIKFGNAVIVGVIKKTPGVSFHDIKCSNRSDHYATFSGSELIDKPDEELPALSIGKENT